METKTKIEDLPTVYDPKSTEEEMYKFWEGGKGVNEGGIN